MYPNQTPLSLTKMLSGVSKTIKIANKIIPIYKQTKPMLANINKAKDLLKDLYPSKPTPNNKAKKIELQLLESNNTPTFFQ